MHLLRTETFSLDEAEAAVDLQQSPAEIVVLSFSDNDLGALAAAWEAAGLAGLDLRLANLSRLRHPFSVDTYIGRIAPKARFVIARVLGGLDYWRYGIDELAAAARRHKFHFAALPGDDRGDPRLDEASTLPVEELRLLSDFLQHGGPDNLRNLFLSIADRLDGPRTWQSPAPLPDAGLFEAACHEGEPGRGRALLLLYRAAMLAGDAAPITALAEALHARGIATTAVYVTSLKHAAAAEFVARIIDADKPDIVLNTTAFSARHDANGSVLDRADAPVLQVVLAGSSEEQWRKDRRGLAAADLAMNVVLPEIDGRLITRAISCKAEAERRDGLEFTRIVHRPISSRVAFVADLAKAWVDLRTKPRAMRRIACILSNYPAKEGRTGYAVGLDTAASVAAIAETLSAAGYAVAAPVASDTLIADLERGETYETFSFAAYKARLAALPRAFADELHAAWGEPEMDPSASVDGFRFAVLRNGNLTVALQPDRGRDATRKGDYHDTNLAPRHAYVAFYLWLRQEIGIDALIHCGTHGTLEWLPGKAVALDESCAPEAVLGPLPVIYPFIVNNPGEAAQAKRRIAAVTLGHLTPPLTKAGHHGAALELEALFDEYAAAEALDRRRARLLAKLILERAFASGLAQEGGLDDSLDPDEALRRLDAWLCDIKEMRIGDGLHVFGMPMPPQMRDEMCAALTEAAGAPGSTTDIAQRLDACAEAEREALIKALDGRFVEPGPAGAPARGRIDVLPTGRNLYTVDPRGVPTRTAWEIGQRTARDVMTRYAQDHGDWPRRIVIDLWGSATMRTGGDDLAQAYALMGVRPTWDHVSGRVNGFEILPGAKLDWPRVDVTLRISGLFRDVFAAQITLFDEAVRAVAALDEEAAINPLAEQARQGHSTARIFGSAPGTYGMANLRDALASDASTHDLGEAYLAANGFAFGAHNEGVSAPEDFRDRVATAQAFVHVQDMDGQDLLDADAFAQHEGGFAAAAAQLGADPALYHADTATPGRTRVRTLAEELARVVRGRAANPRWIKGQMRHGHRGAAEIAETVDNLFHYAALTKIVTDRHFEIVFDATLGDPDVRSFLLAANPAAASAIARRFDTALERGFWRNRRNSTRAILTDLLEDGA